MRIKKAVITAAAPAQRTLPIQTLIDEQGRETSVLSLIVHEAIRANIDDICVIVCPGDELEYARLISNHPARIRFIPQLNPRGYGHAVFCARDFTASDPFLHLVGDHIYVSDTPQSPAQSLVQTAAKHQSAVSAVQLTRESLLPYFGAVGGQGLHGSQGLYRIDTVIEKPTPTEAEQNLIVPGLRGGQYLCFHGMHVLTPAIMDILDQLLSAEPAQTNQPVTLSAALAELARREQYLALIQSGTRFDVGVKYGLFYAQLALALAGQDRDHVLSRLLETVLTRASHTTPGVPA
jgi:UTP--glucose-1-phosphate uridylyltransferase